RRRVRGRRRGPSPPAAAPRRALQGDQLHARDRARARGRALVRRTRRDRRRSQGPRHEHAPGEAPRLKALVVRLSSIGDVAHTLPVLAALRGHGWEAGWVVEPLARPLLEDNPLVGQVAAAPARRGFGWAAAAAAVRALRAARYDAALDFQGLWKSAAWARL